MGMHYSAAANAFFASELIGDYEAAGNWPADAVPVPVEVYAEFSGAAPDGKVRQAGPDGLPEWADRFTPEQEAARLAIRQRAEAQAYLDSTDWYCARLVDIGEPIPDDVKTRRAAARDVLNRPPEIPQEEPAPAIADDSMNSTLPQG